MRRSRLIDCPIIIITAASERNVKVAAFPSHVVPAGSSGSAGQARGENAFVLIGSLGPRDESTFFFVKIGAPVGSLRSRFIRP